MLSTMTAKRIAMWSGPRNISTAMMRAWGNRPDTAVVDEPLYAHYLQQTGLQHPGRDAILASQSTDWRQVAKELAGPIPGEPAIYFQKHMAQHLLPNIERDWLWGMQHAFLLRDPREMLLSLSKVMPRPRLTDTGLPQQLELLRLWQGQSAQEPIVLDAKDVLTAPCAILSRLCERLGVAFDEVMLRWPAGPRSTDGVWAPHWYASVQSSSQFEPWRSRTGTLSPELAQVHAECEPIYQELSQYRLRA